MSSSPSPKKNRTTLRLDSTGALDEDVEGQLRIQDGIESPEDLVDELIRRGRARVESWDLPGAGLDRITGMSAEYALLVSALDSERRGSGPPAEASPQPSRWYQRTNTY